MSDVTTLDVEARLVDERNYFLVFRLSWVVYAKEALRFVVRLLGWLFATASLALAIQWLGGPRLDWLPWVGVVPAVVASVYGVALTCSVRLFTNEDGVWVVRGVFPWEKGVYGVQWRDVGQAGYMQGFLSWLLRSYDIHVSNRFTSGDEVRLRNVHLGHLAVEHVNRILLELQPRFMGR